MAGEVERIYYDALRAISAENDQAAVNQLIQTGSYSLFDEPCSVQIAREALLRAGSVTRPSDTGMLEALRDCIPIFEQVAEALRPRTERMFRETARSDALAAIKGIRAAIASAEKGES